MISTDKNTNIMIEALKGFLSGMDDVEKLRVVTYLGLPVAESVAVKHNTIPSKEEFKMIIIEKHNKKVDRANEKQQKSA